MEKSKLFVGGSISEAEVRILSKEFDNSEFEIGKYSAHGATISGIHDIVHLIFDDFKVISFARDYILGKSLETAYSTIKIIAARLREKQKVVNTLTILREYIKKDGSFVFIQFSAKEEKFHLLIKEVYANLPLDFFEGIEAEKTVTITLNNEDKLIINVV